MRPLFLYFLLLSLSVACVENTPYTTQQLGGPEKKQLILNDCREIAKHGDMIEHFELIDRNTKELLALLGAKNPFSQEARIHELVDELKMSSKSAMELARPEWTKEKWSSILGWSFFPEPKPGNWFIYQVKVHSVYLMGENRNDLIPHLEYTERGGWLYVSFQRYLSSLELCQLQKTLMVVFEIKFQSGKRTRTYLYNLYANSIAEGNL